MTAISWLYRRNCGFVLAADGKAYARAETPDEHIQEFPDTNDNRKIFKAKFKGRDVAYALTGTVFNADRTFDLLAKTFSVLDELSACRSFHEYIEGYAEAAKEYFDTAKRDGRIRTYAENENVPERPDRNIVARVFFAGYFRKAKPSFAIVTLSHENQILDDPLLVFESPPQNNYLVGAGEIARLFSENGDHWVNSYGTYADPSCSLDELISTGKGFIKACCDSRAVAIDPSCRGIGGDIHVARISIESGFEWIDPPQKSS